MPAASDPTGQSLATISAAVALLGPRLADLPHEECHVAYLDRARCLVGLTILPGAGPDSVDIAVRALVAEALALDARALLIAHNHPGGDPTPSMADKQATRRLAEIVAPLDIRLLDHLIFAGESWVSFRALGLL